MLGNAQRHAFQTDYAQLRHVLLVNISQKLINVLLAKLVIAQPQLFQAGEDGILQNFKAVTLEVAAIQIYCAQICTNYLKSLDCCNSQVVLRKIECY